MDCLICNHTLQSEIDGVLAQVADPTTLLYSDPKANETTARINRLIKGHLGGKAPMVDVATLRTHLIKHEQITTEGTITIADDRRSIELEGHVMPVHTFKDTLNIMIGLGVENMTLRPHLVSPTNVLRALQLMKQVGLTTDEEEIEHVLGSKVADHDDAPDPDEAPMLPPDVKLNGREKVAESA